MKLQDLKIERDDFSVFLELNPREKIEFLSDATEHGIEESIIKQIDNLANRFLPEMPYIETKDIQVGNYKLSMKNIMDVDGNELSILKGGEKTFNNSRLRTVYIEVDKNQVVCEEILTKYGFVLADKPSENQIWKND